MSVFDIGKPPEPEVRISDGTAMAVTWRTIIPQGYSVNVGALQKALDRALRDECVRQGIVVGEMK